MWKSFLTHRNNKGRSKVHCCSLWHITFIHNYFAWAIYILEATQCLIKHLNWLHLPKKQWLQSDYSKCEEDMQCVMDIKCLVSYKSQLVTLKKKCHTVFCSYTIRSNLLANYCWFMKFWPHSTHHFIGISLCFLGNNSALTLIPVSC